MSAPKKPLKPDDFPVNADGTKNRAVGIGPSQIAKHRRIGRSFVPRGACECVARPPAIGAHR
jgi:hypothetical protein